MWVRIPLPPLKNLPIAMPIETDWYVITGAPSSGKTKVIEYLAYLGAAVVPEVARVYIDVQLSKGRSLEEIRRDEGSFQERVLADKINVEERVIPYRLTFFDRGIPDTIAYRQILGLNPAPAIEASAKRKYQGVFLLEGLPWERDYARVEDENFARRLEALLVAAYTNLGYLVVRVPILPIDQRAQFIINQAMDRKGP